MECGYLLLERKCLANETFGAGSMSSANHHVLPHDDLVKGGGDGIQPGSIVQHPQKEGLEYHGWNIGGVSASLVTPYTPSDMEGGGGRMKCRRCC